MHIKSMAAFVFPLKLFFSLLIQVRDMTYGCAGDAIWAGILLVVMPLESMAARISASFSFAFPGAIFVARNREEYRETAVSVFVYTNLFL